MPRPKVILTPEIIAARREKANQYHKEYYKKHREAMNERSKECSRIRYAKKKEQKLNK